MQRACSTLVRTGGALTSTRAAAVGTQSSLLYTASRHSSSSTPKRQTDAAAQGYHGYVWNADPERKAVVDEMVRVDHAGEVGAVNIYAGQMWVLKGSRMHDLISVSAQYCAALLLLCCADVPPTPCLLSCCPRVSHPLILILCSLCCWCHLQHMKKGEEVHLQTLERVMSERRVRPTALLPLWHAAGFALGAATALMGKEAAMACTVAVETAIGAHYNDQIRELLRRGYDEKELAALFKQHRDEEMEHHDTALAHDAEKAPGYQLMSAVIQAGCKIAIEVAKKV